MENEEIFEGSDTDLPSSNILEKGRYQVEVIDISSFTSKNDNKCNKAILRTDDKFILTDYLLAEGKMKWKWSQFLYAIGIRRKGSFTITKDKIVGLKCLVDVGVRERVNDDGTTVKENRIYSYSPVEQETAPITGVPSEAGTGETEPAEIESEEIGTEEEVPGKEQTESIEDL